MKAVTSLLCRHELRALSTTLLRTPQRTTTITTTTTNSRQHTNDATTTTTTTGVVVERKPYPRPMTMFDLYKKNPEWLGYDRCPVVKEPLTEEIIKTRIGLEKAKDLDINPADVVDLTPHRGTWHEGCTRVGAIGVKLGASVMWNQDGFRHPVTLIQIRDCTVLDTQLSRRDGGSDRNTQMILGSQQLEDHERLASYSRAKVQWYINRGIPPPLFWARFPVTKDALLAPGTPINANHFMVDQSVIVSGVSRDKGFQGVMRRWGMKGQPASHGQTKTHRKMGATGGGTRPGKVFPRKRMAGHMGGKWRRTKALRVWRVNFELNIIAVKGSVPGETGSFVIVKDAWWKKGWPGEDIPFPGYLVPEDGSEDVHTDSWSDFIVRPTDESLFFPPCKL